MHTPIASDLSYECLQMRRLRGEVAERFWAKVDRRGPDECWVFTGKKHKPFGHGRFHVTSTRMVPAHRVAWILSVGDIPPGMQVRHHCDNPPCCNPAHLAIGTNQDNVNDRTRRKRAAVGARNGQSKLTPELVRMIRASDRHPAELAEELGVHRSTVDSARKGIWWRHV